MRRNELGRHGEDVACAYLESRGYDIIARNWRCAEGEIDIVAVKHNTTAIVEVKTRSSLMAGHPYEAITALKLARLRRLAGIWVATRDGHAGNLRIDAIAIVIRPGRPASVEHLPGVGQ